MTTSTHLDTAAIDASLAGAGPAPRGIGTVDHIVRRPAIGEREVVESATLAVGAGLDGDNYLQRGNDRTSDDLAHPEAQLNIMGSRAIAAIAGADREAWAPAGDQLFVDLDLSVEHLPVGTRLRIGTAVIEVAAKPHNGCSKFAERYGIDAARWVNQSKDERRRGLCAMVVESGTVSVGDEICAIE